MGAQVVRACEKVGNPRSSSPLPTFSHFHLPFSSDNRADSPPPVYNVRAVCGNVTLFLMGGIDCRKEIRQKGAGFKRRVTSFVLQELISDASREGTGPQKIETRA